MLAVEQMVRCWASDSCMVRAFGATRQSCFAAAISMLCSSNQHALQQQSACFAAAISAQKSVEKLWGHFAPEFFDAAL